VSERVPVQAVAAAWTGNGHICVCFRAQQYREHTRSKNISQPLAAREVLGGGGRALALALELGGVG